MRALRSFIAVCTVVIAIPLLASISLADTRVPALEITGPDNGVTLLVGTLHTADARLALPQNSILDNAERLVVELQHGDKSDRPLPAALAPETLAKLQQGGQLTRADWTGSLTPEELAVLRQHVACRVPEQDLDDTMTFLLAARPWYAVAAGVLPCPEPGVPNFDDVVRADAQARRIPVVALTTAAEEERQFDGVADQVYVDLLHNKLTNQPDELRALTVEASNRGDWDEVARLDTDSERNPHAPASWHQKISVERTRLLMPRLLDQLRGGGAVIVVSVTMIGGPDGIVSHLRGTGYAVRPIVLNR